MALTPPKLVHSHLHWGKAAMASLDKAKRPVLHLSRVEREWLNTVFVHRVQQQERTHMLGEWANSMDETGSSRSD